MLTNNLHAGAGMVHVEAGHDLSHGDGTWAPQVEQLHHLYYAIHVRQLPGKQTPSHPITHPGAPPYMPHIRVPMHHKRVGRLQGRAQPRAAAVMTVHPALELLDQPVAAQLHVEGHEARHGVLLGQRLDGRTSGQAGNWTRTSGGGSL